MRKHISLSRLALIAPILMLPFVACSSGDDSSTTGGGHPVGAADDGGTGNYGAEGGTTGEGGATVNGDGGDVTKSDGGIAGFTTIFTIVLENHDYKEVVGDSTDAPFLNSLITSYGLATNYMDSGTHPSLPNYLDMMSGDTQYFGLVDLDPTQTPAPFSADNLGNQLQTAGIKWRGYAEGMGSACNLKASGNYAPKHDPFLYFDDIQTGPCADRNVDYTSFAADLAGGTYRYMYIAPDLVDDGHNPVDFLGNASDPVASLTASDTWCKNEVGKIMASDAYKNGGVIFITWDEAEGRNGDSKDQVPMIVVSPKIKSVGFKSATAYSHKSYLATVEDILGLTRLATVSSEPNMLEFFK
ncbi:MAG: alkaline phosphatase family protein [Polyangiaceae bacterium]